MLQNMCMFVRPSMFLSHFKTDAGFCPSFVEEEKTTDRHCKGLRFGRAMFLVLQNPEAESFQRSQLFKNVRAHEVRPCENGGYQHAWI